MLLLGRGVKADSNRREPAVQYSQVQCSAVQCTVCHVVQYSLVKYLAVWYTGLQGTLHYAMPQAMQNSTVCSVKEGR